MKTRLFGLITGLLLFVSCNTRNVNYVPIAAFEPSYKALQGAQGDNYDIEETVRIINGIELAQAQSESFDDFLEYMARQDYSKVAQDVVDMRIQLLPILQEMYIIDQEYSNINIWSTLGRDLSMDLSQAANVLTSQISSGDSIRGLFSLSTIMQFAPGGSIISSVTKISGKVFDEWEKTQKAKDDLSARMHKVRKKYIEYLEDYMPIYSKYMQEWNQLCVLKDQTYLQLYSGEYDAAVETCQKALAKDPNNREMQLLQSMAIIQSVQLNSSNSAITSPINSELLTLNDSLSDLKLQQADQMLSNYIEQYPTYSAPALLLKGIIRSKEGKQAQAFAYFDQSAIEYPRQAEHLTDMLSSYRARTYLNNTAEGGYLLSLYQSTMEGFGMFSPNFAKAVLDERKGDFLSAREEIYNHFFRRSNQVLYDCLLSDMEYCEDHLTYSFKRLLPENSYMDVIIKRSSKMMGMGKDDHKLKISLSNRSDKSFENIRLFLCFHYTDMYKTDYHVVRVPSLNRIKSKECIELGEIELNYRDKSFNDITRVRAIALTDNSLCWIDNVYNEDTKTDYNPTRMATIDELAGSANMKQRQNYLSSLNENANNISQALKKNTKIDIEKQGKLIKSHNALHIRLPRIVVMLNPVYELNESILPTEDYLQGTVAHLVFKDPALQEDNQLVIKSPYASYMIHFSEYNNNKYSITSVDELTLQQPMNGLVGNQ